VLREPTVPAAELEKVRGEVLTSLREADQDTRSVAERTFRELAYPTGHPYRRRVSGYEETVRSITTNDLIAPSGPPPLPTVPPVEPPDEVRRRVVELPGKSQADIVLGLPSIERRHPDYYALDVLNLILGRLGLNGRIGANVRERQGLAYYSDSDLAPGRRGPASIPPTSTVRSKRSWPRSRAFGQRQSRTTRSTMRRAT
jgi:zinc protease